MIKLIFSLVCLRVARLLFMLFAIALTSHIQAREAWHKHEFTVMGTIAKLEFLTESPTLAEALIAAVVAEMQGIDESMSPYKKQSELSYINQNAGKKAVTVSPELFSLLVKAKEISELSKGAFDITYASVGYYYDYKKGHKPSQQQIDKSLPAIDYRVLKLDLVNRQVKFGSNKVKIDLGGIAKGYAVKRCITLLAEQGIKYALVSAGGDTAILGDKNGRPWYVGVKHPRADDKQAVILPLQDEAISTSGDYERYFLENGQRYHHIINPKTGKSTKGVLSVSVIGADATITDALSTTVFVLGLKQGLALIDTIDGYDAVVIDQNQRLHFSKGLQLN